MAAAADLLASLDAAIAAFLANGAMEEYQLSNGRRVRRASLSSLMAERRALKSEVEMEDEGACIRFGISRGNQ